LKPCGKKTKFRQFISRQSSMNSPETPRDALVPDRRAVQRAELGHVHFVEIERQDEIAGGPDRFRRLAGHAEDEQALGAHAGGVDLAHVSRTASSVTPALWRSIMPGSADSMPIDTISGAGFLQHVQHLVGGVAGADGAVPLHRQRLFDQQLAQVGDPLLPWP
jgi:hypothetical protein